MINHLEGKVTHISGNCIHLVLAPPLGLGFAVYVAHASQFVIGNMVALHTHMHWNQEQGPTLYGFTHACELALFELLIDCSGIGPKIALGILEQITPPVFVRAVQARDVNALRELKGVGAKKAEQLVIQLKDSVDEYLTRYPDGDTAHAGSTVDVAQVLQSLGYSRIESQSAIDYVCAQAQGQTLSFDHFTRKALAFLSRRA